MREGSIVADGPKESVLTEERLRALFGVDLHLTRDSGYFHVH